MINLFKKLRIAYGIILISVLIIYIVDIIRNILLGASIERTLQLTLGTFSLLFACVLVFLVIARNKYNKILSILNDECDAVKFVNEIFPLSQKTTSFNIMMNVRLNLAAGYINLGDFAQSNKVLNDIDAKRLVGEMKYAFLLHKASVLFNENNILAAEQTLAYINNTIYDSHLTNIAEKRILDSYNLFAAVINIEKNIYDGAEEVFRYNLDFSDNLIRKVNANWNLAKLYQKQNRVQEAKSCLEFVVEHGNTLHFATLARQQLEQI